MKFGIIVVFLFVIGLTPGTAVAQMSMMSGVVLDESGHLAKGARVKITRKREAKDYWVGANGMYYSLLLPSGYYYHVDIRANDKYYKSRLVYLAQEYPEEKVYYNFRLKDGRAELFKSHKYPADVYKNGEHVPQPSKSTD